MAADFDGHIEKPLSPEHQRVRQTRGDGSVVIYAGAQEVETQNQQVTVKTYWVDGASLCRLVGVKGGSIILGQIGAQMHTQTT